MSGIGATTTRVTATGDQYIDGLLAGDKWADQTIFYAFSLSSAAYNYSSSGVTDLPAHFRAYTTQQKIAASFALDGDQNTASVGFSFKGFTAANVQSLGDVNATSGTQIRFAGTTSSSLGTAQVADFPGNYISSDRSDNGDVWAGAAYDNNSIYDLRTPQAGNYAWFTQIHEVGHALGLKHPHETNWSFGSVPLDGDMMEFTVMSYRSYENANVNGGVTNHQWDFAQTYMMLDIAALQAMYGADYTTNADATVYRWTPGSGDTLVNGAVGIDAGGSTIFMTVWDGGGNDTYDFSAYSSALSIDLRPGKWSVLDTAQLANLGGGHTARGSVFNALEYHGNTASLIENAVGGTGNDTLVGNEVSNILWGNTGNDTLSGLDGNDVLRGGAGADILDGGAGLDRVLGSKGHDTLNYGFARSQYVVTQTGALISVRALVGSEGTDYLTGVETLHFADQDVSAPGLFGDFNGDGRADIALQNQTSLAAWVMNGATLTGGGLMPALTDDWSAIATGDTNGDLRADVLLQKDQQLALWQMNGVQVSGGGLIGTMGDGWTVAAMSDLTGDGRADILLQNDRQLALWQMNGAQIAGGGLLSTSLGDGWQLAGTADLNGDGRSDLVLQNGQTVALWLMNGTQMTGGGFVGTLGAGWSIFGTGDLNGDSKADLVLQNGQILAVWQMNGFQIAGGGMINTMGTGWHAAGLADLNGDGRTDIALQNGQTLAAWEMNGANIAGGGLINAALGSDWELA
ncbi:hypothetical protein BJF92_23470 [Rhizobium rhizosphaerae]|uniref:Peptidase M10 serralysin C-terminal domain-containing protein n=1 Tax=Xaviernesmea rhizosphaerae TaxID=1672749 RepID=A0A1Q9AQP6_9HYPH|nr:FG-GAP-like repeat-containing protein [Xaviernesmea rhizosphaerae]OLP57699.1 hypothetical protein BJF92_23470 [Xaviernesmea rhizosphaerae]